MAQEMIEFAHLRDSVSGKPLRLERPPGFSPEKEAEIRRMARESGARLMKALGASKGSN